MISQNNAAQAAKPQTVLSFDERERILCQFIGEPINHDREMAVAIETAELSKLRAPVANVPLTHRCANCGAVFQGAGCPSCRLAAPLASAPVADARQSWPRAGKLEIECDPDRFGPTPWHITDGFHHAIGATPNEALNRFHHHIASAPVAGEPVYTLSVKGVFHNWKPTTAAFSIPDGEHQLFLRPAAPQVSEAVSQPLIARALDEWHEDDGPVTWWAWCGHEWAGEAPWCGTPLDQGWPRYHTHWTPIPGVPAALSAPQASAEYERGHADGWAAGWDQAIKQPQADKDGGQQRAGDDDALRFIGGTIYLHLSGPQYAAEVMAAARSIKEWFDCQQRAALSAPQAEQGDAREA